MRRLGDLLTGEDALMKQAAGALAERFGVSRDADAVGVYVPGRVEFLGKHTDYAGGRSLLMTVAKGFRLVAAGRDDKVIRISAGLTGKDVREFTYGQTPPHQPGHWVNYASTIARRVEANFAESTDLRGADMAFVSDLPVAAGMSSSSALVVAIFLGISAINRLAETPPYRREIHSNVELAAYLGCAEMGGSFGTLTGRDGVGTFGGSEDHTAMLCCKADTLSQFSFAPSVFERDIPFPAGMELVIACSGVEAPKTGSALQKYNRASVRARKAAEAYNRATGDDCKNLRNVAVHAGLKEALDAIREGTSAEDAQWDLPERFEQFFREDQEIIPAVGDALAAGKVEAIGELVDASHAGARLGLENLIPETDFLQQSARQLGATAASYFGAGFGGSVWAMIAGDRADEFRAAWSKTYNEHFPQLAERAEFFITRPGEPAHVV